MKTFICSLRTEAISIRPKPFVIEHNNKYAMAKLVGCIIIKLLFKTSARASRIFSELDINGDGELSCDEFIRGCMQVHEYVSWSNYGVYNYTNKARTTI